METVNDSLYELGITHEMTSNYPMINSNERLINCKYNLVLELLCNINIFNLVTTSHLYL